MSRPLFAVGFILLLASALAARADDDKPKDKDEKEKLTPAGQVTARLSALDTDKQTITLEGPRGKGSATLEIGADAKVRTLKPPLAFDDKGNPRKYTPQELKDLKGTEGLPGYMADLSDLKAGQIVRVSMSKRKKTGESVATLIVIERRPDD